jgi:Polyketide cyclase / dehydrase and lipid transport
LPEITSSYVLAASAEAVWRLLADFAAIQAWWPTSGPVQIDHVEVEGQGVGMIRHVYNKGMAHPVSERLDLLDPAARTLVLSIIGQRPPGITAYVATGRLTGIDAASCRLDYRALITTEEGREGRVRDAVLKTWSIMIQGLENGARLAARP